MARYKSAIFFCLSVTLSILSSLPQAFGGEWHSAGNAPVAPYPPKKPSNFFCTLTGYTTVGKKSYRTVSERIVDDKEFRTDWPNVVHVLEKTGDPGMDGQAFTLNFSQGENDDEVMNLNVTARANDKVASYSRFSAPRSAGVVRGVVDLNLAKSGRNSLTWVRVAAECKLAE